MTDRLALLRPLAFAFAALASSSASAVTIDGVFDPDEWAHAQRFDDFVLVQPLTGAAAPADRRTEAYLLSTPEGIAVAVRAWHPEGVPQTRNRIQRDGREAVDRMNFMIDFDADGRVGYDFTITTAGDVTDEVIANENHFNLDWDGAWQHAVADFEGGYVAEWLIPWSIAQMRNSSTEQRTVAVYFDRVIVATGERFAYPAASFTRPRFVSDFAHITINQHQQAQLAVTPYVVGMHDQTTNSATFKAGADVFWKPSGDHQFALTVNPDFGQVESDNLVIDFSNVETFFTDKRPFFTENQSYFELQHNLGTLFYTRRVGAMADDGSGSPDIRAAVKGNGSFGQLGYGVFRAEEDGPAGRTFSLVRTTYDFGALDLGLNRSRVDRPFLDRQADVTALDARWQPNARWQLRPLLMHSHSDTQGLERTGKAAGLIVDWDMPGPWRQQYFANYADRNFELNDLGYQARNDSRYFEWESGYRQDHLPANSRAASHDWELEIVSMETTDGLALRRTATLARYSELRNGGNLFGSLRWRTAAWDDRLSRGHGAVPLNSGLQVFLEHNQPRQGQGRLAWSWNFNASPNPVSGHAVMMGVQPRWHLNDHFDIDFGLYATQQSDWLIWQGGREFGSFRARRAELYSNMNWFIDDKQELRVKLQAIAINATALQARRLDSADRLIDSAAALDDFTVRNLGFQVRYRYKLAKLSDFYAVYSRGGFAMDEITPGMPETSLIDTLTDAFALRDSDQLMIKLAYRFDL